jgi:transcriptional regulator with XRE-family HTH domain
MKIIQGVDVKMFAAVVKEINNGLDLLPIKFSQDEIGKKVGLKRNTVSTFLSGSNETNFMSILKFAKLIHPRDYIKAVERWATLHRKTENVKFALEFLSANRMFDTLREYINTLRNEVSPKLFPILDAYSLMIEYQTIPLIEKDFIHKIENLKESVVESKFIKKMLEVYYYNYFSVVNVTCEKIIEAERLLDNVEKNSLKALYEVKLNEMRATCYLFNEGNPLKSREFSERVFENIDFFGATYRANAYYKIGMSYFYESPDMCLINLRKAAKIYRECGEIGFAKNIEENEINFAKVYWGTVSGIEEVAGTPSEAHYLIRIGRLDEAAIVISGLDQESPFTRYYKGLAENNPFLLLESLKIFRNNGNEFYAKLPLIELEKYPEASGLIKLL